VFALVRGEEVIGDAHAWNLDAPGMYKNKFGFGVTRAIGRFRKPLAAKE
jgi:hypothetical protein